MRAGESARGQAEKARLKAERLLASAERWEKGADGERRTAEVLTTLGPGWEVAHDLAWPGRRYANLDHVVVGPTGIVVVDTKNWSGQVTFHDGVVRQNGYRRDKEVDSAAEAALAVGALVPDHLAWCRPTLCFVGRDPLLHTIRGVTVCSSANLRSVIESGPIVLEPAEVHQVAEHLREALSTRVVTSTTVRRPRQRVQGAADHDAPDRPRTRRRGKPSLRRRLTVLAVRVVVVVAVVASVPTLVGLLSDAASALTSPPPAVASR